MGGFGSGRKTSRTKADDSPSLDVLRLWKAGQLEPGVSGVLKYRQRRGDFFRIGHLGTETHLLLVYPRWRPDAERKADEIPVPLIWSHLPYGGARPYFCCPASSYSRMCKRRVAKLYLKDGIFLCRHCHKLTYQSQSETHTDRLNRRADKIRQALTRDGLPPEWIPARPKGMWQRTYEAKMEEIFIPEGAVETAAGDWLEERYGTRNLRDLLKEPS